MPNVENSLSVIDIIIHAGLLVQFVMAVLFIASVGTWAIIFLKRQVFLQATKQNEQFVNGFWGGWSLSEAFTKANDYPMSPVAKTFLAGIKELRKLEDKKDKLAKEQRVELVLRSLQKTTATELAFMEHSLSWLATTASSAPFIGLFGTVWGIMNSFRSIGATGSANLAAVAPGISEALIATAIGLAAAIPAAIAYNFMIGKIRAQALEIDSFSQDLLNLLQREGSI